MRSPGPGATLSTSVIEPGARLAGRYRLDDRVSEAGGSTFWKATDEILARSVAVLTFDPGFPHVGDVVTAARAASRLTDPRLTQVFDADDSGERAYVVSEWVIGDTLNDLLAQGPMEPDRAAAFLLEAAEAVTSAHRAGLAHLCLGPHNLVWTSSGTVKITGLGVEAVLSGATSDIAELDDARGLAGMLYAALTGYWPGGEGTGLPAAPTGADGCALPPGQVRAGIPHNLDSIVCRTLGLPAHGGKGALEAPSAFADAVSRVPRSPLPFVPLVGSTPPAVLPRPEEQDRTRAMAPTPVPPAQTAPDGARMRLGEHSRRAADRRAAGRDDRGNGGGQIGRGAATGDRGPVSRPVLAVAAVIAVVVLAVGGWGLSRLGGDGSHARARVSTSPTQSFKPAAELTVAKVSVDDGGANPDTTAPKDADKAIDGKQSTYWTTQYYFGSAFGGRRNGVGLVLDIGKSVTVDKVTVTMPPGSPGKVELRVGDSDTHEADKVVGTGDAVGTFDIQADQAKGRYVILWFTKLPKIGGRFQAQVKDVKVHGTG